MRIKPCFDINVGRATVFWDKGEKAWILPGAVYTSNKARAHRTAERMNKLMTPASQRPSL